MTTLASGFEDDLREAILDDVEQRARDYLAPAVVNAAEGYFRGYASRHGYDVEHIWEDASWSVSRDARSVEIRVEWPGLTALFEWGVSPHTIEGSPLAFEWKGPPAGTRPPGAPAYIVADEVNWGSVTGGIPEARAIRRAIDHYRREIET